MIGQEIQTLAWLEASWVKYRFKEILSITPENGIEINIIPSF